MKKIGILLLLASMIVSAMAQKTRILFLGNSYTAVNNLPQTLANLALSGGDTVVHSANTPGGYTFQLHSQNATSVSLIKSQVWDYVVLQEQSQIPAFSPSQVATDCFPYAMYLDSLIGAHNPCAKTMFYMTWGRKYGDASNCANYPPICTYDGMSASLRSSYLQMGALTQGEVAPVGMAWKASRAADSTLNLWSSDNSHPSIAGTYLTACVFYASIFQKSPIGLPFSSTLPVAQAAFLQNIAHQTVFDSLSTWYIGAYDPKAAFSYTQNGYAVTTQNTSHNAQNAIWNFGDGTSSTTWDATHTYASPSTYALTLTVSDSCRADTFMQTITVQAPVFATHQAASLGKGMNLSYLENYWLGDSAINYTNYLDLSVLPDYKADIALMSQMGFKTLRLPICFSAWEDGIAPYSIDSVAYFRAIDSFLVWTNQQGMKVILDFHHGRLNKNNFTTESNRIAQIWGQVAQKYAATSPENVLFELYNEPWDLDTTQWKEVSTMLISAIRAHAPLHTLIVGGLNWNAISGLTSMRALPDSNIIYTFHFYDPMIFTHQGADWVGAPVATQGIPFPYNAATMPAINPAALGTWGQNAYNSYATYGNAPMLANTIGAAKIWSLTHQLPIFCGEWGSYKPFLPNDGSRCRYTETVKNILDSLAIPFTYWEWDMGFSLFDGAPTLTSLSTCMADIWDVQANSISAQDVSVFSIYPNPVNQSLTIKLAPLNTTPTSIRIFDMAGKEQMHSAFQTSISVETLPAGVYWMEIAGARQLFVKE